MTDQPIPRIASRATRLVTDTVVEARPAWVSEKSLSATSQHRKPIPSEATLATIRNRELLVMDSSSPRTAAPRHSDQATARTRAGRSGAGSMTREPPRTARIRRIGDAAYVRARWPAWSRSLRRS